MSNHLDSCHFYACSGCAPDPNTSEIKKLKEKIESLQAARYACATEFSPGPDGQPDVGRIRHNIRKLKTAQAETWVKLEKTKVRNDQLRETLRVLASRVEKTANRLTSGNAAHCAGVLKGQVRAALKEDDEYMPLRQQVMYAKNLLIEARKLMREADATDRCDRFKHINIIIAQALDDE